jgi:amino acid adenylation domain-containing protein
MSEDTGFEITRQQWSQHRAGRAQETIGLRRPVLEPLTASEVDDRLAAILARHEILRTTFSIPAARSAPLQVVRDDLQPARDSAAGLDPWEGPVLAVAFTPGTADAPGSLEVNALALVADVPSLDLLADELARGEVTVTDPIQYAEYASWQVARLTDADASEEAAALWGQLVTAASDADERFPEEPAAGPASAAISEDTAARITRLAAAAGVDPRAMWLAAWVSVVQRFSGAETAVVGLELDPRTDPELAGAIGPYAVVAPIVADSFSFDTIGALAADLEAGWQRALAALEWGPDAVADAATPTALASVGTPGARLNRGPTATGVELRIAADGSAAHLHRHGDSRVDLDAVVSGLAALVASAGDAGRLADAEVITAGGRDSLLGDAVDWSMVDSRPSVVATIREQVISRPDQVALTDGTTTLTYTEMWERVSAVAAALQSHGARVGAPVATLFDRSVDAVVALLAIQVAGAPYLPLDINSPSARSLQILKQAEVDTLLTNAEHDAAIPDFTGTVVRIQEITPTAAATEAIDVAPTDPAYVIFTSGSTGVPKGVSVPHRALANYCAALVRRLALDDAPRQWAIASSLVTDLAHTSLFPALVTGGTLHVVPGDVVRDPHKLTEYAAAHPFDVLKITPSHLDALLSDPSADVLPREILVLGGEALPWDLVDAVAARASCRVFNHYGPTETTVGALAFEIAVATPLHRQRPTVPIGFALSGAEALVVNPHMRLAPPGATGELVIAGAGLALGYINDEVSTAQRFVPHPYRPGERVYLTGDLARRLPDGTFEFMSRRDGQVKIRGYRVERGEVEAALRRHPAVLRAAVVIRPDPSGAPHLVGYFVPQVNPAPTAAQLREHLGNLLPDYMHPAQFVEIDELPLGPSGKLNEAALPLPAGPADGQREFEPPATAVEKQLAEIFAEVLGIASVGATDDFFALGGHSLLAVRITVKVRDTLGVQIPVYALFETPTVRALAGSIEQAGDVVSDDELQAMIDEVSQLSEQEVIALLEDDTQGEPR